MKPRPPLHGYNTNYRREGTVYHVQTEDLGSPAFAVVTQVFTGGTILAIRRTPYEESPEAEHAIRELMRKQHKALLVELRAGAIADPAAAAPAEPRAEAPAEPLAEPEPPAEASAEPLAEPEPPAEVRAEAAVEPEPALPLAEMPPPPVLLEVESERPVPRSDETVEESPDELAERFDIVDDGRSFRDTVRMEIPPEFAATLVAQGRAREAARAREDQPAPAREPEPAAPGPSVVPPPTALARPRIGGSRAPAAPGFSPKQTLPLFTATDSTRGSADGAEPRGRGSRARPRDSAQAVADKKPTGRTPRVFSDVSRAKPGFGEDHLGERSLDEVILSYLAEELQDE